MCQAGKDVVLATRFIEELGSYNSVCIVSCADNMGTLKLIKHLEQHKQSKHVDVQHHYIREVFADGHAVIIYILTVEGTNSCLGSGIQPLLIIYVSMAPRGRPKDSKKNTNRHQ